MGSYRSDQILRTLIVNLISENTGFLYPGLVTANYHLVTLNNYKRLRLEQTKHVRGQHKPQTRKLHHLLNRITW